jgi:acyl-CoA reductase-like NAD-dependent aldehyde dehydrogenase
MAIPSTQRLDVLKTYKLFIGGAFPRTESGRTSIVYDRRGNVAAHLCRASRKDLRNAVEIARTAQASWAARDAYNRGQILHRMAEVLEGRRDEFVEAIQLTGDGTRAQARREHAQAVDRLICFAGWCDKFSQVLGCHNPVSGPYHNFTIPEAVGVVAVIAPQTPALLGLLTAILPPLSAGNTIVVFTSEKHPIPAVLLGEVCATSDVPGGVVNILTGLRSELLEHVSTHREIDAISATDVSRTDAALLRAGVAENLKRVHIQPIKHDAWDDPAVCESPWTIEPFVEMKTIWHPSAT